MDMLELNRQENGSTDNGWHGLVNAENYGDHPTIMIYLVMIILATCSGTIGNTMVIGAVLVNKNLRTVGNVFIVNLAIADLCVTAFVDPFNIVSVLYGSQWFSDKMILCEVVASVCLTSCFCSLLSIGAIGFNRYVNICHTHWYSRIYTLPKSLAMCVVLWVLCFILETPNMYGWGDHVYDHKTLSCVWDRTADLSYTMFFSLVGVCFPVVLISICYLKIYLFVRKSKHQVAGGHEATQESNLNPPSHSRTHESHANTSTQLNPTPNTKVSEPSFESGPDSHSDDAVSDPKPGTSKDLTNLVNGNKAPNTLKPPILNRVNPATDNTPHPQTASDVKIPPAKVTPDNPNKTAPKRKPIKDKEYLKLARTLFIIFVIFAFCWVPYAIIVVVDHENTFPREIHIFTILFAHTNSSLNSIIYGLTNKHFRRGYLKVIGYNRLMSYLRNSNGVVPRQLRNFRKAISARIHTT